MPIVDGSIHYEMPAHIKGLITPEFCSQFLKELHQIFGCSVEDSDLDYFVYQGGTAGWGAAFANVCRKLNLDELYKYYLNLEWFDSDVFDGLLEDFLVEYKLILGVFLSDEVARQNNLPSDKVTYCDHCGKYFHKDNLIENKVDLGDESPYIEYICKTCATGEDSGVLLWDIKKTLVEIFNKSESDIFICEKCGKPHWNAHRGKQYCLYCENEQLHTNCNVYYRESLDLNKKYRDKLLKKNKTP